MSTFSPVLPKPPVISLPIPSTREVNPHKPTGKHQLTSSFLPTSFAPA